MFEIRNCNVAVVGGAGFLGSHLVNHLIEDRNCGVMVIDNLSGGQREFVHKRAHFLHADITRSESYLRSVFAAWGAKFVFNYAAMPYIPVSFVRPLHVFEVNALGAMQVINAAAECGCCERILQVSSAELYGGTELGRLQEESKGTYIKSFEDRRIAENWPVQPHSSYGASKAAVDYFCQAAHRERDVPVIALRQFNCVGERETHPYVVPEIISQIAASYRKEKSLQYPREVKLGNNSYRDFMYAGDAVAMAVELLEKGTPGEVYNLGSEEGIQIYDLAQLIATLMHAHVKVVEDPERKRPWEIWHLQSSNEKIYSVIDRRPMIPLNDALRRTVQYYTENGSWAWEI